MLKGRVNYIDTVWFDGERWIERNYRENGDVVYSVYVRDTEDEKEQTKYTRDEESFALYLSPIAVC